MKWLDVQYIHVRRQVVKHPAPVPVETVHERLNGPRHECHGLSADLGWPEHYWPDAGPGTAPTPSQGCE